jgi:co-chaperonin GroES (HSP10)
MYDTDNIAKISKGKLPEPAGWKILIEMPKVQEKTDGGILRPDNLRALEETASILGYVRKMGNLAYKDKDKFPDGPWCKVGDWVMFRSYSGTRFKIDGQEFRVVNDDTIDGVVSDAKSFRRA